MFDKKERDYVSAAIRCQSYSEAAEEQFTTKATIRNAVLKEEEECGKKFFTKKNNRLIATLAAKSYLSTAKEIEEMEQKYRRKLSNTGAIDEGCVRIGGSRSFIHNLVLPLIFDFHEKHPHVEFVIETGNEEKLIKAVLDDELDIVLAQSVTLVKYSLSHEKLLSMKPILVVNKSHPIAQKNDGTRIDWSAIHGEPFVGLKKTHPLTDAFLELKHKTGTAPKVWIRTDNAFSATWIAHNTGSWTLTSESILRSTPVLANEMKAYYLNDEMGDRFLEIAYDNQREQPQCVHEFYELIKRTVQASI